MNKHDQQLAIVAGLPAIPPDDHQHDGDGQADAAEFPYNHSTLLLARGRRWRLVTDPTGRWIVLCANGGSFFVSRSGWIVYRVMEGVAAGGGLLARLSQLPMVRVVTNQYATVAEICTNHYSDESIERMLRPLPAPDAPQASVKGPLS